MNEYKKFNREIKGYVVTKYKTDETAIAKVYYYNSNNEEVQLANKSFTRPFYMTFGLENVPEFAILKENYTKLDGSKVLFNNIVDPFSNAGYISELTPNEVENNIIFTFISETRLYGATLYFRDNTIKNANIKLYKGTEIIERQIIDNNKDTLFIETSDDEYTKIDVEVLEWTRPDLPVWVTRFDAGLTHIYKGNELIEFEITEQVNKLVEETPNNELRLTIGDYENLYDPLNPTGILKYLSEDVEFIPYIGIQTENGGVNYTKMGTFYFDKIDYNEKEVTLTAYNFMSKMAKVNITNNYNKLSAHGSDPGGWITKGELSNYLFEYLNTDFNYGSQLEVKHQNFNINNKIRMTPNYLKPCTLAEFLQNAVMIDGIFYVDRDDFLIIREIDKTIKNSITKSELLKDIKYTNIEKINSFNLERSTPEYNASESNSEVLYNQSFVMEKSRQTFIIESDNLSVFYGLRTGNISVSNADAFILYHNGTGNDFRYMAFVDVLAQEGNTITISIKPSYKYNSSIATSTEKVGNGKALLNISNPFYATNIYRYDDLFTKYLEKTYSYRVDLEYNGDVNIQAGDYIEVESNYGMVPIFVQKHTLKYNGGLSGTIEGVE